MSYISCPFCGGGVPGMPCRCGTPATPFAPQPRPPATLPPTPLEAELLRRIEKLEAEVARLREALEVFADDRNWFDATEDNIRYPAWRGPVDEPEEFARAALAEQEKDDE